MREASMMESLNHPAIVKFFGWFETEAELAFVVELMSMSLGDRLRKFGKLPYSMLLSAGHQVAKIYQCFR